MKKNELTFIMTLFVMIISTSFTKPSSGKVWSMTIGDVDPLMINDFVKVDETDLFLDAIGHKESGNRYDVVNKFGYMGRYQFGKNTLKGLGFNVTKKEFLSSPEVQEKAMISLLEHNKEKLQPYIDQYVGDTLRGIHITESGILAAAHLAGCGNVKKFFKKGHDFRDGFGTRMTSYMEEFGGYDIVIE